MAAKIATRTKNTAQSNDGATRFQVVSLATGRPVYAGPGSTDRSEIERIAAGMVEPCEARTITA